MVEENKPNEKITFVKKRKKQIIISIVTILVLVGVSYAWFRQSFTSNNKNILMSGKLILEILNEDPIIKAGGEDGYAIPMTDVYGLATTPYTFTVTNTGTMDANFEITLVDSTSYTETSTGTDQYGYSVTQYVDHYLVYDYQRIADNMIRYNIREGSDTNTGVTTLRDTGRILITGTLAPGATKTYQLRLWVSSEAEDVDTYDKTFAAQLSINAVQYGGGTTARIRNEHIKGVYEYIPSGTGTGEDFTGCLGGAEAGCVDIRRTISGVVPYQVGTIIKYEVKDGVYKYFNVIKDNGTTLTLQQRENTVNSKAWYGTSSDYTNANGPALTSGYALYELEQATSDWTYVNDQTYSIGDNTTTLGYSGCSAYNNCDAVTYTLSRTGKKARMITIQETKALGCTGSNMSCPKFMNNYLGSSTSYGGTFTGTNSYYWTMSANSSGSASAWLVNYYGGVSRSSTYFTNSGARAVVVVEK